MKKELKKITWKKCDGGKRIYGIVDKVKTWYKNVGEMYLEKGKVYSMQVITPLGVKHIHFKRKVSVEKAKKEMTKIFEKYAIKGIKRSQEHIKEIESLFK